MLHIKYMYGKDVENAVKDRLKYRNNKSHPSLVLDAQDIRTIRDTLKHLSQVDMKNFRYNLVIKSRTLPYKKLKSLLDRYEVVYQECVCVKQ